jgi:hypothetical protein
MAPPRIKPAFFNGIAPLPPAQASLCIAAARQNIFSRALSGGEATREDARNRRAVRTALGTPCSDGDLVDLGFRP